MKPLDSGLPRNDAKAAAPLWHFLKGLTYIQVGGFLALLIVAVMPNFGFKYGPSPAFVSGLLMLLGIWLLWKRRAELWATAAAGRLTLVFSLLLVPALISVPTSHDLRYSWSVCGALLAYYLAGLALVRILRADAERIWLAKWILWVMIFWIVDSLIQYSLGVDPFGVAITVDGRVTGPFKDSLRQSMLLALLLPVGIWFLQRRSIVLAFGFFAAAGFVAMLGSVRMVLVMLMVVALGLSLRLPSMRFKIPAAILAIVVVLSAIGLSSTMQERLGRLAELREINFKTVNYLLTERLFIWDTASNMLQARPLTGVGVGAFAKAYDNYSTRAEDPFRGGKTRVFHAHQAYMAMAAEAGIPGLIGLFLAIALCVKWYWSAVSERRMQAWPYALGLLVYFFPLNSQPPMYHGNWLFAILLLMFTAFLAALDTPARAATPNPV